MQQHMGTFRKKWSVIVKNLIIIVVAIECRMHRRTLLISNDFMEKLQINNDIR